MDAAAEGVAAAAVTAGATATSHGVGRIPMTSEAPDVAPRLVSVSLRSLSIGPIRIALGVAGLIAVVTLTDLRLEVAVRQFFVGAIVFSFIAVASESRRAAAGWTSDPPPPPPNARYESAVRTALDAAFPSTVGVAVLMVAALFVDVRVSAILGGLLAGMGLAALVVGVQLAVWERRRRVRLYTARGHSDKGLCAKPLA